MPAATPHPRHPFPETGTNHATLASLQERWSALQVKADEIAALADLGKEQSDEARRPFAAYLEEADERTTAAAERGVENMELLASMGLKALTEVRAREKDAHAPALALWRELYHAREAVLSVLEPIPA